MKNVPVLNREVIGPRFQIRSAYLTRAFQWVAPIGPPHHRHRERHQRLTIIGDL